MNVYFDHEKLKVYQTALRFVAWADELVENISHKAAVKDQLDRAATSMVLNIAEGNGKYSSKDRCRFLEIARGSAVECAACLDVIIARKLACPDDVVMGKEMLFEIVRMLIGLHSSLASRVSEESASYAIELGE